MTLEQVYVGLDTRSTKPRKESDSKAAEPLDWWGDQTPRSLDWRDVHELAPFNRDKITPFIDTWYRTLSQLEPAHLTRALQLADQAGLAAGRLRAIYAALR